MYYNNLKYIKMFDRISGYINNKKNKINAINDNDYIIIIYNNNLILY